MDYIRRGKEKRRRREEERSERGRVRECARASVCEDGDAGEGKLSAIMQEQQRTPVPYDTYDLDNPTIRLLYHTTLLSAERPDAHVAGKGRRAKAASEPRRAVRDRWRGARAGGTDIDAQKRERHTETEIEIEHFSCNFPFNIRLAQSSSSSDLGCGFARRCE
jgi:hypothetical protein